MRKIDWFITLLITLSQAANALKQEQFNIRGTNVSFVEYSQRRLFSQNCLRREGQPLDCSAARAVNKIDLQKLRFDRSVLPVGAVICMVQMKGRLMLGKSASGRETTFCEFADRSFIDIHTIAYYANKKHT